MITLNRTERHNLTSLRNEILRGVRSEYLDRRELAHLAFHRWRGRQLDRCPCGYDWDGCRCITDAADEIAH